MAEKEESVTIAVVGQDGKRVSFRVKKTTVLDKVLGKYCEKMGISEAGLAMYFGPKKIGKGKTLEDVGIGEKDEIQVQKAEVGGWR